MRRVPALTVDVNDGEPGRIGNRANFLGATVQKLGAELYRQWTAMIVRGKDAAANA